MKIHDLIIPNIYKLLVKIAVMKKKILLFSSSILLLSGLISSYDDGPTNCAAGNRTGSQGTTASCSGVGCHAANSANTSVLVTMLDGNNNIVTNGWEPGVTYKIRLSGNNPTMTKYGFQLSSVSGNGISQMQSGSFSNAPVHTLPKPSGTLSILEHTQRLDIVNQAYETVVNWTAPALTTVDTVKFYATVNAVNNNSSTSGDEPNTGMFAFPRNTTSIAQLNADIKISAFPNPITDRLNINMENADNGTYTIRVLDMNGKVVASQTANVSKSYNTSINAAAWASGMYHIQLQKDGAQRTIPVVKQ